MKGDRKFLSDFGQRLKYLSEKKQSHFPKNCHLKVPALQHQLLPSVPARHDLHTITSLL